MLIALASLSLPFSFSFPPCSRFCVPAERALDEPALLTVLLPWLLLLLLLVPRIPAATHWPWFLYGEKFALQAAFTSFMHWRLASFFSFTQGIAAGLEEERGDERDELVEDCDEALLTDEALLPVPVEDETLLTEEEMLPDPDETEDALELEDELPPVCATTDAMLSAVRPPTIRKGRTLFMKYWGKNTIQGTIPKYPQPSCGSS